LFEEKNLNPHQPAQSNKICSSYFLEDMPWMETIPENDIKINCPNKKCKGKLGEVTLSGRKCSCGKWISPAL